MSDKKKLQLGMNPSTAANRLVKDILWDFISKAGQDKCCKCDKQMSRETFSIEHVVPWLDSENPEQLYFDLTNISFSHRICNIADGRKYHKKYESSKHKEQARLERRRGNRPYDPEKRRNQYLTRGT